MHWGGKENLGKYYSERRDRFDLKTLCVGTV